MITKVLILFAILTVACAQKTPVYIYYESLCPDSQAFITKQLYPSMKILKDHVDLHFIPFGKSTTRTQGADVLFECHHGPNECYGNKFHVCALTHIQVDSFQSEHTRETLIVDYINCLMSIGNSQAPWPMFARQCAEHVGVKKYDSIELCANTTEGSKLLEDMGEKTNKLESPLRSVPTITIRESYDATVQQQALTDFQGTVCNHLPKPMPAVCRAYSGASSISASIATFIASVVAIFVTIRFF